MIASDAAGHRAASRILVNLRTAVAIAAAAAAAMIGGCSAAPAASGSAPPVAAAASAGGCAVDAMKICKEAEAAGTLEAAPMTMGAASSQSALPRTARVEIPGGPAVQAMCYYDPQHKNVTRADWTATATLDANAIAYLKSKKLCTGP